MARERRGGNTEEECDVCELRNYTKMLNGARCAPPLCSVSISRHDDANVGLSVLRRSHEKRVRMRLGVRQPIVTVFPFSNCRSSINVYMVQIRGRALQKSSKRRSKWELGPQKERSALKKGAEHHAHTDPLKRTNDDGS